MERANRGIVWGVLLLLFFSAGCTKKMTNGTEDVTAPDGPAQQGTLSMPAGEGQALAQTIVTHFDGKNVFFGFDKYSLNPEGRQILTEIAAYLKENADVKLNIEGHCDERGTNEYNMALGDRRAIAARDFLVTLGVDPGRIGTISYGEEKPADIGKTEEAWSKNRRGEFIFSR